MISAKVEPIPTKVERGLVRRVACIRYKMLYWLKIDHFGHYGTSLALHEAECNQRGLVKGDRRWHSSK